MGKKGVSYEEKRKRMLEIFYSEVAPSSAQKVMFNLKELEKLGQKKGVIPQSIQDVIKSLIGDGLVETEKIGSGVYFWALPSKAAEQVRA